MQDFKNFTYLDLQKTGSTYVVRFLRVCSLSEEKKFKKHDWIRDDYNKRCFYFITIREPLSLYSSLYRYGLEKKGALYKRLLKKKLLHFYDSFNNFSELLLDSENANLLDSGYNKHIANQIGFMSFRFMKLSMQFPLQKIHNCLNKGIELSSLENDFITNIELKNEFLNDELLNLTQNIIPEHFDQDKVQDFINRDRKINKSKITKHEIDMNLSDENFKNFCKKERLLISRYKQ